MDAEQRDFLERLIEAPGPSGYERPVREEWRKYTAGFADSVVADLHGNVIATRNPDGAPRVMFAGHCDELGFQVNYIADEGFIYFNTIGGHDAGLIPGRRVVIHADGGPVRGVTGRKAVHVTTAAERGKAVKLEDIWIDIGVADRAAAEELVRVGDAITYDLGMQELQGDLAVARAFDNKVGAWVVAEALRRARPGKLDAAVVAVATVQEEIGLRGATTSAFSVDPTVAVAVDVTHATDSPGMNKKTVGDVKLGGGPVIARGANINPVVEKILFAAAADAGIEVQVEAESRGTGTDANAIQISRAGVATGLVGVPLRYMHSPSEVISLADAEATATLLAAFAERVRTDSDFTP